MATFDHITVGCYRNRNAEDPQFPTDMRAFFQAMNNMMALHSDQVAQIHESQVSIDGSVCPCM